MVITNAILTVDDEDQALVRAGDDDGNKGAQAALAALETLAVIDSIRLTRRVRQLSRMTPGVPATTSHELIVDTGDVSSNWSATARKVAVQRSGVTSHTV